MKKDQIMQALGESGIIAVIRADSYQKAVEYSEACIRGGIKGIEITFTTPMAHKAIEVLNEKYGDEIVLGAGSVMEPITARIAMLSGAKFIVSASLNKETAKLCNIYQVPYLPGCMTIKEIACALEVGAAAVKVFPGSVFGPSFIKAIHGPLPQALVMPTGGVNLGNVKDWVANGCQMVGVGSALSKGSVEDIEKNARAFMDACRAAKESL
jgi:2-dehydro-3-deoxyphosphogluconate aldolase/(4S)-4-hydroxy-2-oxoglutarate aldolase